MALYKYPENLTQSNDVAFDTVYGPGDRAPYPGVYKCLGCRREIAHNAEVSLPPQNHHQHTATQGTIRWRMIVNAQTNG